MTTTTLLPDDYRPHDAIHRVSLLKHPSATTRGLVLLVAIHNDLGTRVSRDAVAIDVAWTWPAHVRASDYTLLHGGNAAHVTRFRAEGVDVSQFDTTRVVVPLVHRSHASTMVGAAATASRNNRVKTSKSWAAATDDAPAVGMLPFATLTVMVTPTPLARLDGVWAGPLRDDWILPLRIEWADDKLQLYRPFVSHSGASSMVLVREPPAFDATPLGSSIWDAAIVLAAYLTSLNESKTLVPRNATVIELGAGCAALARLLSTSDPSSDAASWKHVLTDLPDVLEYMQANAPAGATCASWAWGDPIPAAVMDAVGAAPIADKEQRPVAVIGTDIHYNEAAHPALLSTLADLVTRWPAAPVVMAFKRRSGAGEEQFMNAWARTMRSVGRTERPVEVVARWGEVFVVASFF
ncbi:putative methyltransferase-domain-containing protein [Blastocladiella britannica]|nr:putative methyltransferase-domain-containing protein [Blastocladiella britannica]